MSSRESILRSVKGNQPEALPLPEVHFGPGVLEAVPQFQNILSTIGASTFRIKDGDSVTEKIRSLFPNAKRIVSAISTIEEHYLTDIDSTVLHSLHDVDVAIVEAQFGVAENGAVWVTEENLKLRVLPFIVEHLVAVVNADNILNNMHEAYERIADNDFGFGVFIAGPSKTADIEQSLVLGAHGPKTMTVLIKVAE
jgi:L-lactate dehydrogenase complex protein LldG